MDRQIYKVGLAVRHRPESTFSLKEHTLIHAAITAILIHVFLSNFKWVLNKLPTGDVA